MRKVSIHYVQPGSRLARPIFNDIGNVLLGEGSALSERIIKRLEQMGIYSVYIQDEWTAGIEPESIIDDRNKQRAMEVVHQTVNVLVDQSKLSTKSITPELTRQFSVVTENILQDIQQNQGILVALNDIYTSENYLLYHSVDVVILAGIMGTALGYNQKKLRELCLGALLFDIGMTKIPPEIKNKSTALTEEERMILQSHTEEGYKLLKEIPEIPLLSAHVALQHHERFNGEGYPRNLKGENIHEYARIVAIADVFSALISPRPYRKPFAVHEGAEFLYATGGSLFDPNLVKIFVQNIALYPVATTVKLNNGLIGVVVKNNKAAPHRPVIKIFQNEHGQHLNQPYEIDLQHELTLTIAQTL